MVIHIYSPSRGKTRRQSGWLMIELLAALALLLAVVLPIAYSFASEKKLARSQYYRGCAMQIVDGEFELLAAGGWRSFSPGTHEYRPSGWAVSNLPPGEFTLEVTTNKLRLEWSAAKSSRGGHVVREIALP